MNPVVLVVVAVLGAIGGVGGIVALLTVRATRAKIMADTGSTVATSVRVLLGGAEELVEGLKRELNEARALASESRADLASVRRECYVLERRVRRLVEMIHEPDMDLDQLRAMFPRQNGD